MEIRWSWRCAGKDVSIEQVSYDSIAELGVVGPAAKNAALPHPEAIGVDLDDGVPPPLLRLLPRSY